MTEESEYSISQFSKSFQCFISIWDEEMGPKVIDFYPKTSSGNIVDLSVQIFTAYQHFWDIPGKKFEKASFTLPIQKLNKKAKILLDVISNSKVRGNFQPFVVVLLVLDFYTETQLTKFNDILMRIAQDFSHSRSSSQKEFPSLKSYYQEIKNRIELIELEKEKEPKISEYYSYTAAIEDFNAAINLFKKSNYNEAYQLFLKVLKKFKEEKHDRLKMEVLYLLGTISAKQKRFKKAQKYFQQLTDLAKRFSHQHYLETAIFMDAFCYYKSQNYDKTLVKLEELESLDPHHITMVRYLTIYGKTLIHLRHFEEAEQIFFKAVESAKNASIESSYEQFSHLYFELGVINYRIAFQKAKKLDAYDSKEFYDRLEKALLYFDKSTKSLKFSEKIEDLPQIYSYISEIYELLDNDVKSIEYLYKAFKISKSQGLVMETLTLLFEIVRLQANSNQYDKNVEILRDFISEFKNSRIFDLFTKGLLYKQLGLSLIQSKKEKEGLKQLMEAHAIFEQFRSPIQEDLKVLRLIKQLYKKQERIEEAAMTSEKIKGLTRRLEELKEELPENPYPLGDVREIWIFSADAGLLLYSYAPETNVDHDLVGGFLTALKQLSIEVTQQELHSITVGIDRYTLFQEKGFNLFILGRSTVRNNEKKVNKILKIIYTRFLKEYSEELKTFAGNIAVFNSFTENIHSFDFTLIN